MAEDDVYTKDGTVDYHGNPANRKKTGTWKACPFILGNECCERLAYYGMSTNLVIYFKNKLHQHSATASKNVSNWSGTCYITPLIGAFVADSYLGRYWTIALFSIIYVIGMTLLTLSASVSGIKPTCHGEENCHATVGQTAVCFLALYLVALGTGGIKPCVSSYGADQFDDADPVEKEHKSSFFNWFYFSINIGALIASSLLVWIQENVGWEWGFGIPAVAMAIAVASFFSGTRLYRNQKPGGSALTRICQVVVASIRKYHVQVPADKSLLYEIADTESAIEGSRKLDYTNELRLSLIPVTKGAPTQNQDTYQTCTFAMFPKRFQGPKTGFQLPGSMHVKKHLKKFGLEKEDYFFWKQVGKALLCTYAIMGAVWIYKETSPLGWWSLKPRPKEERELAEFPYPGDEEAKEFVAKGGVTGTSTGPNGMVENDKNAYNYQKELEGKKVDQEAQKLWLKMRDEVIAELQEKGFKVK